jgi:uncharacterized Zn finger protein (UPF0148 family)
VTEPSAEPEAKAVCPYCGCGFVPAEPGQVYCWPGCEQQHKLEQERAAGG